MDPPWPPPRNSSAQRYTAPTPDQEAARRRETRAAIQTPSVFRGLDPRIHEHRAAVRVHGWPGRSPIMTGSEGWGARVAARKGWQRETGTPAADRCCHVSGAVSGAGCGRICWQSALRGSLGRDSSELTLSVRISEEFFSSLLIEGADVLAMVL